MNTVLIVGSGGREHALLKALLRSDRALCIHAHPGNPGMANDGCMAVEKKINGWSDLADWAAENDIDLTIVGPEIPLVEGIVDIFKQKKLAIFGPTRAAARIEGSKEFSKRLMKKYGIPTADFSVVTTKQAALDHLKKVGVPVVVKASGLAAGKGAVVCDTMDGAQKALADMFDHKIFGDASKSVVLEEKMIGEEASVFVLTDGKCCKILPVAQDHKRVGDGDSGPNTGGMGAYAPAPVVDARMLKRIEKEIVMPTLDAMRKEGCPYQGLLYVGVMITDSGPKVVEYNCRFGDPETQAVLPLVDCDWYEVFRACATGTLADVKWRVRKQSCAAVVLASQGYPGKYDKGKKIEGISSAERARDNVDVYHAGTALDNEGNLVTSGGRVLAVSAWADSLRDAIDLAYDRVGKIRFDGKMCRKDIGAKGLARLEKAGSKARNA
jgi:phosphoribosylamine--glycine ligase